MSERITDHCFVPQGGDGEQLTDVCAFAGCEKSEIDHEWTVEAVQRTNRELFEF